MVSREIDLKTRGWRDDKGAGCIGGRRMSICGNDTSKRVGHGKSSLA